ncbi:ATP-binding protein [Actinoplanes sp. HUAS TT8]|uniref:ATP-binding protein n=1 Tax=Actinoplanes sp. HUAS TT8 TaxID=3447453 RepID=UPI003F526C9D
MNQHYTDTVAALGVALLADIPVVLWGAPGQGKSSVVEALGEGAGFHVETVIASLHEPTDFAGIPAIDPVNGTARRLPPDWARRVVDLGADGVPSIVFYDEISTTPPATQAALLRPILTGWVGDLSLPAGTRSVAAANPPDVAADGWDLAPPLANRFLHLHWSLPADVVRDGFTVGWPRVVVPRASEQVLRDHVVEAKALVAAFLNVRPELVTRVPASSEDAGRAFPTPRSWEMAARLYAAAKATGGNATVTALLLSGAVGPAAAGEFTEFLRRLDLPDPEALLADPESYVVPTSRGDKVFATAAAVFAAMSRETTGDRWLACGTILAKIAEAGLADMAFLYARRWAQKDVRPPGVQPTSAHMTALAPILREIGLLTQGSGRPV